MDEISGERGGRREIPIVMEKGGNCRAGPVAENEAPGGEEKTSQESEQ